MFSEAGEEGRETRQEGGKGTKLQVNVDKSSGRMTRGKPASLGLQERSRIHLLVAIVDVLRSLWDTQGLYMQTLIPR